MLKFKIINSPQEVSGDAIPRLGEGYQRNFLASHKSLEQVFIIGEDEKEKVMGRACLLKKRLSHIHEDLRDLLEPFPKETLWECCSIDLDPLPSSFTQKEHFLQSFLYGLYQTLVEFGKTNGVSFTAMRLLSDTYRLTKIIGAWPYVVELGPSQVVDGFFYGILPLTGSQREAYYDIVGAQKEVRLP